jgi:hypothetical protein
MNNPKSNKRKPSKRIKTATRRHLQRVVRAASDDMTETQKQNITNILRKAQGYLSEAKKAAPIGKAIEIANREAQVESYFRAKGIEVSSPNNQAQVRR